MNYRKILHNHPTKLLSEMEYTGNKYSILRNFISINEQSITDISQIYREKFIYQLQKGNSITENKYILRQVRKV